MADLTQVAKREYRRFLSIILTSTIMSGSSTYIVASSVVWVVPFAVIVTDAPFDF